ncbi:MAG: hypothetical protein K0R71_1828 [Bacillales bacterium]|jgi:cell division protein FtsW (lipid II flippase)|nr:hypothetical protein [Bacillales bacterium]
MQSSDKISAYVGQICEQIRWKKARLRVEEEMISHVIDQRNAFIEQGLDEEVATEKAIADSGDATLIGTQFDRTHRPKPQWSMLAPVMSLLLIGLIIQLFIFDYGDIFAKHKLTSTAIGIIFMLAAYYFDFTLFSKYPKTIYFTVIAISFATLRLSPIVNGKSYYSQYFILLFPLVFAAIIFATRNKGYLGIILCDLAFLFQAFITIEIRSYTGFFLFSIVSLVLLSSAISKNWFNVNKLYGYLLMLAPFVFFAVFLLMNMSEFMLARSEVFYPSYAPYGIGHWGGLTIEKLLNYANLFGIGRMAEQYDGILGASYFQTDLILTAITVRLGWITTMGIIGLFLFFIIKGFIRVFKQKSGLGLFVSLSIMLTFSLQVVIYVLFNLGFQILSPLSLPFVSYGNLATITNMGLIGFMLSVFRTGDVVKDEKICNKNRKFLSWQDSKLTIDFKGR